MNQNAEVVVASKAGVAAKDVLAVDRNFRSLSVKDLLEARDLYHNHLVHKANVVGTAIGLYLIRKEDPWPNEGDPEGKAASRVAVKEERRFYNSEVRPYSWPCVLVLVDQWIKEDQFHTNGVHPTDMVPKTLYMPDGRTVPVCVVRVLLSAPTGSRIPSWQWPQSLLGGGMPLLVDSQGEERIASTGCLVSDGHTTYALTNRHVCGAPGTPVYSIRAGRRLQIGRSSRRQITRRPFTDVYPDFVAHRTFLNLDVGLVDLDDVTIWTSQVFGLGGIGPLADLSEQNISLHLINADVRAHGAASGRLEGKIKALFYRYKSVGGYDYVADFLIAPQDGLEQTQPGDSGTVWHLLQKRDEELRDDGREQDRAERRDEVSDAAKPPKVPKEDDVVLRPLAVEWGGQVFVDGGSGQQFHFALATSLSNVCKLLDVELVQEHNTGVLPYWGQMGHYSIGSFACDLVKSPKLKTLMEANRDLVSFTVGDLDPKTISERLKAAKTDGGFVPLADVPDIVWKNFPSKVPGGRDNQPAGNGRSTGPEHPTHFADVDEPRDSDGAILRDLSVADPNTNLTVPAWQAFYTANGHTKSNERGLLPFRVWQFYDVMTGFVMNGDIDKFVCAAGLVSHYVGDACQPLHGSMFADGFKDQPTVEEHHHRDTGEAFTTDSHVGAGVHSTYESKMIDRHAPELVEGIQSAIQAGVAALPPINNGHDAATATIKLMDRSAQAIPPVDLVNKFVDEGSKTTVAVQDALWDTFGDKTIEVMVDGARVLAAVWDAAWIAGGGEAVANSALTAQDPDALAEMYRESDFVPSLDLDHIGAVLQ